MSAEIEARIADWFAAQPGFDAYELAGLTLRRHGKRAFVEVLLDRKTGQITLDECGRWNRALSDHLELSGVFSGPYLVEISSPGVDRPLTRHKDFERVMGRTIKVRYQDAAGTAREFTGRLEEAGEAGFRLRTKEQELSLSYAQILQARQEINFSKETKEHGG